MYACMEYAKKIADCEIGANVLSGGIVGKHDGDTQRVLHDLGSSPKSILIRCVHFRASAHVYVI